MKPDDFFSVGPIGAARFGNNIVFESNWSEDEFMEMQRRLIDSYPEVVREVDELIAEIVEVVRALPPEELLQRAWGEMAVKHINVDSESQLGSEDSVGLRMVDYLQSILAAVQPSVSPKEEITEEDWETLIHLVKSMFEKVNQDYQLCRTAMRMHNEPDFDLGFEEFYYKAQIHWCNVRGDRYMCHEEAHLRDLLLPHSHVIRELFGITAEQLISEMLKIRDALTRGIFEAAADFKEFQESTLKALELWIEDGNYLDEDNLPDVMSKIVNANGWEQWQADVYGRFLGYDLFDLQKQTDIPESLLNELSWGQGEDTEFFAEGEFKGWPLRIWPIFKRPFIKLDGRYYCFDLYSLLDHFYRVLEKAIRRLKPDYRGTWNQIQKEVSEQLPFKYFEKILPGATTFQSVYYRWYTGKSGTGWCEADGLLIYDDHLVVIEVKGGAFTYTSPADDFPAYVESLENLVLKPAEQGKRFVEYLNSDEEVEIFDEDHNRIGKLVAENFRQITICAITLDPFTELAAQVQHLKEVGVDVGDHPTWSISIDDLRVYSDVFDNPLIFLHFLEQRMAAFKSDLVRTDDELDHLGLYLKHNMYSQHAHELAADSSARVNFVGYREELDKFFTERFMNPNVPCPLRQQMPERLSEILACLSHSTKEGSSKVASYLLNCGGEWRDKIAIGVDQLLGLQRERKRPLPMSTHGDTKITTICWQTDLIERNRELSLEQARIVSLIGNDDERLLLELFYSAQDELIDIKWTNVRLDGIPEEEMPELQRKAEMLKQERIAKAGKIGRNQLCPCGSGKKHKKCCLK